MAKANEVISARHGAQTDTSLSPGITRGWKESRHMRVFRESRTAPNRDLIIFIYPLKKIHEDAKSKNKRGHGNERVKSQKPRLRGDASALQQSHVTTVIVVILRVYRQITASAPACVSHTLCTDNCGQYISYAVVLFYVGGGLQHGGVMVIPPRRGDCSSF